GPAGGEGDRGERGGRGGGRPPLPRREPALVKETVSLKAVGAMRRRLLAWGRNLCSRRNRAPDPVLVRGSGIGRPPASLAARPFLGKTNPAHHEAVCLLSVLPGEQELCHPCHKERAHVPQVHCRC